MTRECTQCRPQVERTKFAGDRLCCAKEPCRAKRLKRHGLSCPSLMDGFATADARLQLKWQPLLSRGHTSFLSVKDHSSRTAWAGGAVKAGAVLGPMTEFDGHGAALGWPLTAVGGPELWTSWGPVCRYRQISLRRSECEVHRHQGLGQWHSSFVRHKRKMLSGPLKHMSVSNSVAFPLVRLGHIDVTK